MKIAQLEGYIAELSVGTNPNHPICVARNTHLPALERPLHGVRYVRAASAWHSGSSRVFSFR
jgi:hypothetical protein